MLWALWYYISVGKERCLGEEQNKSILKEFIAHARVYAYVTAWICAAGCLPKPMYNTARRKQQNLFPWDSGKGNKIFLRRESLACFFYLFTKPQNQQRQQSSPLDRVSFSFHCQCLPLAGWGLEPHLSWGTQCSTASSWQHLISSVQEKNRSYLSWSCLQPQKLRGVSHSVLHR